MRVTIVDDNPIERLNLRTLLAHIPHVKIAGEADSLAAAKTLIATERPDAIFLDIELGQGTGFQLLEELPVKPLVVFTTLHREYAVQAFDVKAVDYLLKPISEMRVLRAVQRLQSALALEEPHTALEPNDLLVFKQGSERHILPVERLAAILGDRSYTRVLTAEGKEYLDDRRMRDWQMMLPQKHFRTLDRSTIVNLSEIQSYRPIHEGGSVSWRNAAQPLEIGHAAFKRLEECAHRAPSE